MLSCTNALAQTIEAIRKQDRHHPNTPDITQTIQALNKQSFPHLHPSFPRRRESIIMRHLATQNGSQDRRVGEDGGCSRAPTRLLKQSGHHANRTGSLQTPQALTKPKQQRKKSSSSHPT